MDILRILISRPICRTRTGERAHSDAPAAPSVAGPGQSSEPGADFAVQSYSQEGEDMILARVFSKANGFFVDVGAHHPFRFSNTYHFYRMGWSGINIDANAEHVALFREKRPRDINVHSGVGESEAELEYFEFDDPALNTFSKDRAAFLRQTTEYTVVGVKKVPVRTLAAILDSELPRGQEIDFLSVDVEGLDLAVLRSNNWQKYRPRIILVEELDFPGFKNLGSSSLAKYLGQFGYELFAKSKNTLFFKIPDES